MSIHIPVALIALALSTLFFSQIKGEKQAMENIDWQSKNADKQFSILTDNREKLTKAIEERKTAVATSEQTQKQFTDLMRELDTLARTGDKDATQIIKGYGIKVDGAQPPDAKPPEKTDDKPAEPEKKDDKPK